LGVGVGAYRRWPQLCVGGAGRLRGRVLCSVLRPARAAGPRRDPVLLVAAGDPAHVWALERPGRAVEAAYCVVHQTAAALTAAFWFLGAESPRTIGHTPFGRTCFIMVAVGDCRTRSFPA